MIIFICSDLQKQTLHFTIYDVAFNLSLTLATTLDQKSGPIKYQIYTPGTITTIQMYCTVQYLSLNDFHLHLHLYQFNPLHPNIKIVILICCPCMFSKEVVGRIC